LDGGVIFLGEGFEISINSFGGSEDVDFGGFDFPSTLSASAIMDNIT
jgi:hypothetical protein